MKLTLANKVKLVAIPAIALAAGIGLAACGSEGSAPASNTPASSTSMPVSNE